MKFEWDEAKAKSNLAKHGVSFALASRVWDDPLHELVHQPRGDEERWLAVGSVGGHMIVVVVHVYVDDDEQTARIISARKATSHERQSYEQQAL